MTDPAVVETLRAMEPIFHHASVGDGDEVFEAMTSPDFWEVGASGRVYARDVVVATLVERYSVSHEDDWSIGDFDVRALGSDLFLATYELRQGTRITRRSTLWRRGPSGWLAEYHQGTVVDPGQP